MRLVLLAFVRLLQTLVELVLWCVIIALLIRLAILLDPSAGMNSWPLLVLLRRSLDQVLVPAGTAVGVRWPASSGLARYFPLAIAAGLLACKSVVGRVLRLWRFRVLSLTEPRPVRRQRPPQKGLSPSPPAPAAAEPAAPEASQPLRAIGRYEILEELGRGAMGAVYKALDPQIGRTVALKVILTRGLESEELRSQKERFYREARAAGKLAHPSIVAIYDVAEDSYGSPYLVMEFVEGMALDRALSSGGPAQALAFSGRLSLAIEIASALDYAHRSGVIHRDIKPSNILMTRDGRPKIADFGIAKLVGSQSTIGGQILGTPAFISPEQLTGAPADARSDIFSFGVMLYWIFTGERPFHGETMTAVSYKVVHAMPPPARQLNGALPEQLDRILFRCLAKNPADRYQSAMELAQALEALRDGRAVAV